MAGRGGGAGYERVPRGGEEGRAPAPPPPPSFATAAAILAAIIVTAIAGYALVQAILTQKNVATIQTQLSNLTVGPSPGPSPPAPPGPPGPVGPPGPIGPPGPSTPSNGTNLPDIYPFNVTEGNTTCAMVGERLTNGLWGNIDCLPYSEIPIPLSGVVEGNSLATTLIKINPVLNGAVGNSSCYPRWEALQDGRALMLDMCVEPVAAGGQVTGPLSNLTLGLTGYPGGVSCPNTSTIVQSVTATPQGLVVSVTCVPLPTGDVTANTPLVSNTINGTVTNPNLNVQPAIAPNGGGSIPTNLGTVLTYNKYGIITNGTSTIILLANGTAITSSTNSIVGNLPELDLPSQAALVAGNGGVINSNAGNVLTYNIRGIITSGSSTTILLANGTTVTSGSSTITGTLPEINLVALSAVNPGEYGSNVTCLLSGTIDKYGRTSNPQCFDISPLIGGGGGANSTITGIIGTPNGVTVTFITNSTVQLNTAQPIGMGSSPTFAAMTLSGLTPHGAVYANSASTLADVVLGSNAVLMGIAGADPVAGTITASAGVIATYSDGNIAFSLNQTGVFSTLQVSSSTVNTVAYFDSSHNLVSTGALSAGQFLYNGGGATPVGATFISPDGSITIQLGSSTVAFSISNTTSQTVGNLTVTSLPANRAVITSPSSGLLTAANAGTDGQLFLASTLGGPAFASLVTSTLLVSVAPHSLTIDVPQPLTNTSNVTFNSLSLTSLPASRAMITGAGGLVTVAAAGTDGQVFLASSTGAPAFATLTSTTLNFVPGSNSLSINTPQPVGPGASPTFAGLSITGFGSGKVLQSSGGTIAESSVSVASLITTSTTAGGDLQGTYPNPTIAPLPGMQSPLFLLLHRSGE